MSDLEFLDPGMLWLALLVPLALALRLRGGAPAARFGPASFVLAGGDGARPLPFTGRRALRFVPGALAAVGLLGVVAALARPISREPIPPSREGIDILLCLDTSSSMAAKDLDRSRTRLDVARDAAARFVADRPDDRIGLIGFARYPDVRCPLTLDHRALGRILADVVLVASDGPEDATGLGTAVARAGQVLQGHEAPSRVLVLLTDGVENVASERAPDEIAPIHAAQLCETLGVRVYVVAVGLGERTRTGEWVAIDTRQVETLARRTGGRFFTARDAEAVTEVYAEIDALETVELPEPRVRLVDRFLPFLLMALGLLALGRLLGSTVLAVRP